jgi:glycosyltransferase involved in cell wall biosynthesis
VVERLLLQAVSEFDIVVTMGSKAIEFFTTRGVATTFHAVPGGIDRGQFSRGRVSPDWDLILVARLAPIKRIDIFLRAVAYVKVQRPDVRAVVVGEGEERASLERLARELGLVDNVTFAGQQHNVEDWLSRSRVFVLTSDSEGLPLSLMEAMLSGLPGIVPDIGELSDLIADGRSGYLVRSRDPEAFAEPMLRVLADAAGLAVMGRLACEGMARYETGAVTRRWDVILGGPSAAPQGGEAGEAPAR